MKDFEPKWKFVKNLGEGGQAHTYLVESGDSAGSMGAAKRLKNEKREPRFNDEIDALRRLDHPCSTITPRSSDDLETILGKRANQQRGENALGADALCLSFKASSSKTRRGLVVDSVSKERGRSRTRRRG